MATTRKCTVCDKRRDPETGLCPTPEACDKLRAPGKRARRAQAATAERVRRATSEHAHLGTAVVRNLVIPGDEQRHAEAVRRATTGWKRPRRSSQRERVA